MSVKIPHRFLNRLLPGTGINTINYLILGTFNPGEPDTGLVTKEHHLALQLIFDTPKYKRFAEVSNFYDRPQNRFWGVMDRIDKPALYLEKGIDFKNLAGLKFFKGMDRVEVFNRQQAFCNKNALFISDLVCEITTTDFAAVYNNFSDAHIDGKVSGWNTPFLKELINRTKPRKIILNMSEGPAIPNISKHIQQIKQLSPAQIIVLPSTSGAAGYTYPELMASWSAAINLPTTITP